MPKTSPQKEKKTVPRALASMGAVIASIYGVGYLVGNRITTSPTVDTRLEQIIKPRAIKMAGIVLKENMTLNNNIVITRPDSDTDGDSEEDVSISSIVDNQWITVEASMFRDKNGQLDPTTVNEVDIHVYDCDPPGEGNMCGGDNHNKEEVDLIYGDDTTFTDGNWGVEDNLSFAGNHHPNITVNTATKNPTESADTPDAQEALKNARIFSKVAMIDVNNALQGRIDLPKPQKTH
jgi:hypothetical protein